MSEEQFEFMMESIRFEKEKLLLKIKEKEERDLITKEVNDALTRLDELEGKTFNG